MNGKNSKKKAKEVKPEVKEGYFLYYIDDDLEFFKTRKEVEQRIKELTKDRAISDNVEYNLTVIKGKQIDWNIKVSE